MLLRIPTELARLGMFIERLDVSWIDSPFWSHRFRLQDPSDLRRLLHSTVRTLVIDLSKGAGPERRALASPKGLISAIPDPPKPAAADKLSRQNVEISEAAAMLRRTTARLAGLFETVRNGGGVDIAAATEVVNDIEATMRKRPRALLSLTRLKSRDEYTYRHSIAVSAFAIHFARYLRMDADLVRTLGLAAMLHDVGKLAISPDLIGKPGKLTNDERAIMQTHPRQGVAMLAGEALPDLVRTICLHHHERIDGHGYPDGLSGNELGFELRIVSICDVYDAVTSIRPYRKAWSSLTAYECMSQWHGQFDPHLLRQFFHSIGVARPASLNGPRNTLKQRA